MDCLAAQAFVFFLGGFETSSTTMTFCLYELSLHQDIQDRLREEIDVVLQKHDGKLTYEGIQEMEYLDKVVSGKTQIFKNITQNRIYALE
jgi:cytochrome P450 family 6